MTWISPSSRMTGRLLAVGAALASVVLLPPTASAQDAVQLTMVGDETIDPNERISGDAAVGINFVLPDVDGGSRTTAKFDIDAVYAYFYDEPVAPLRTQLTTVDGRYFAEFRTSYSGSLKGKWAKLELTLRTEQPLNTGFLGQNYDHDREIAILVTDSGNPKKLFPVRWGNACATGHVRIRVHAEGADAYVVSFKEKPKGGLAPCIAASDKSQFKFDYNCDMRLEDMQKLKVLQVIRKRGATYEKPIPISLVAFDKETANSGQSCAD